MPALAATDCHTQIDHSYLRDLERGLNALPPEQREVLLLVTVTGLSYREVSEVLSIPQEMVMSRLSQARENLRQSIDSAGHPSIRRVK